jgi:NAD(P)-dependent dehydrogenase (short-subunit alcohol dehydrogenase family)
MGNEPQLTDKVAVVFGGSRGIGAAIVRQLAADGASVALNSAATRPLGPHFRGKRLVDEQRRYCSLVRGVAIDLAPRGIAVNNVQPGPTATDVTAGHIEMVKPLVPLGRMGEPEEVAALVGCLASTSRRTRESGRTNQSGLVRVSSPSSWWDRTCGH